MRGIIAFLLLLTALGGCVDDAPEPDGLLPGAVPGTYWLPALDAPVFEESIIIDGVRAGGEPVIAVLPSGTILVSAHPGWTHFHPSDDPRVPTEVLLPANAQSYLWRSTDGGATWDHVDLIDGFDNLPRSTALGVSDPEFTVMPDGTVCMTDLLALAESSVSCSQDDGQTWLLGNSLASMGATDRQWLASADGILFFTANYLYPGQAPGGTELPYNHRIQMSRDRGLTWQIQGDVPCSQDLVGNPHNQHLVVGCTQGISVSEDLGVTWSTRLLPEDVPVDRSNGGPRLMTEPAIDSGGNVWMPYQDNENHIIVAGSPDEGETWPWHYDLAPHFQAFAKHAPHEVAAEFPDSNGTFIWPWISAGSDGRIAVTWIGSYNDTDSDVQYGPWYIFTAYIIGANTDHPRFHISTLTPDPMHEQPICQAGTVCQFASMSGNPEGDRRLGDFFETTIDAEGFLHATWSNTADKPDEVVSHAQYARQIDGIRLLTDDDIGHWMPTQG